MEERTYLPNLPQLEWVQSIRDPIWGEIPITAVEKRIIQTEAFYRLRGIKQLSFAYLAFPGAVHSRFEHSLGVMHATDMLLKMVRSEDGAESIEIRSFARQLLRLAALLHDIGHPPFSHAMENLFTFYPDILENYQAALPAKAKNFLEDRGLDATALGRHETVTQFIICEDPDIKEVLRDWIVAEQEGVIPAAILGPYADQIIRDVVAKLAVGEVVNQSQVPGNIAPLIRMFKSIMSGDIDADKIDYLARDNYYCGLPHGHDLTSLRNQLIPREGGLEIQPGAIGFVRSLILARHRLISEVHEEKWGVFATAKVIEVLHRLLVHEPHPAKLIFEVFTEWDDTKLLTYLLKSGDATIKAVLTTQYPLKEIARLDYPETHPYIRECIQILSEPMNHCQIPKLQDDLRAATGRNELFVHISSVKSPEFSMELAGGGNLLRDEILRGISEESIKHLHLVVYGDDDLQVDLAKTKLINPEFVPCEQCERAQECIGNLGASERKRLLAELAVRRYRQISKECGENSIIAADFLLLIMEKISEICEREDLEQPIRQNLYRIARLVLDAVRPPLEIRGIIDFSQPEITSTFYQEVRKYEQMGLIAYAREIRRLKSEEAPHRDVFRPDRRFRLSKFGKLRLDKVRQLHDRVEEYCDYIKSWRRIEEAISRNEQDVIEMLKH